MHFFVLSHLRWNFVYQRPQHLLARCAKKNQVWFCEEPEFRDGIEPTLDVSSPEANLTVIVPQLPAGLSESESFLIQRKLIEEFIDSNDISDPVLWYYTPMARNFTRDLTSSAIVYDCMDELSAFRGAPPGLRAAEAELLSVADLVFTGGPSLYQSKRTRHQSVHCFPSSIDFQHFAKARTLESEPEDQSRIPHPRLGYCGVIDERMDLDLIAALAEGMPESHLVMIGPVVKISEADLPRRPNIHWLGGRKYDELPAYMSGWDVALLPFALNESTKFVSPTKTPEYLAAGLPVVSTPITDVVRPYGEAELVSIANTPAETIDAIKRHLMPLSLAAEQKRLATVDGFLSRSSWQQTWDQMFALIEKAQNEKERLKETSSSVERKFAAGTLASAD